MSEHRHVWITCVCRMCCISWPCTACTRRQSWRLSSGTTLYTQYASNQAIKRMLDGGHYMRVTTCCVRDWCPWNCPWRPWLLCGYANLVFVMRSVCPSKRTPHPTCTVVVQTYMCVSAVCLYAWWDCWAHLQVYPKQITRGCVLVLLQDSYASNIIGIFIRFLFVGWST